MPVLKARIGGVWVPVSSAGGGGAGEEEVFVGPDDPTVSVPTAELWYDTDAAASLSQDYRWNTAWGTINRITKGTTEAGYTNTEFAISGFSGIAAAAVAGRYTRITVQLVHSSVTQPSAASWYTVRLRTGSGVGGTVLQEFIYPWVVGQQSYGGGPIVTQIVSTPMALAAGSTFTVTMQAGGSGLAFGLAIGSFVAVEDLGPVSGAVPVLEGESRWNTGWGLITSVGTPGAQTFTALALADVTGFSVTWIPVVGRRYLTTMNLLCRKLTATGDVSIALVDGVGSHIIGSVMSLGANGYGPTTLQCIDVPSTTTPITRKVQCHPGTASAVTAPVAGYGGSIVVEDIGPASGAVMTTPPIIQPRLYTSGTGAAIVTSGTATSIVASVTVPAQSVAGKVYLSGLLYRTQNVATDQFDTTIHDVAGTMVGLVRNVGAEMTSTPISYPLAIPAATAQTYTMRLGRPTGTGVGTTFAIAHLNYLNALFVPD